MLEVFEVDHHSGFEVERLGRGRPHLLQVGPHRGDDDGQRRRALGERRGPAPGELPEDAQAPAHGVEGGRHRLAREHFPGGEHLDPPARHPGLEGSGEGLGVPAAGEHDEQRFDPLGEPGDGRRARDIRETGLALGNDGVEDVGAVPQGNEIGEFTGHMRERGPDRCPDRACTHATPAAAGAPDEVFAMFFCLTAHNAAIQKHFVSRPLKGHRDPQAPGCHRGRSHPRFDLLREPAGPLSRPKGRTTPRWRTPPRRGACRARAAFAEDP